MKLAYLITMKNGGNLCVCDTLESIAYDEYIEKHGPHFSEKLAKHAIDEMENRNGEVHKWTAKEVEESIRSTGFHIEKEEWWDAWYLANMAYADYFGSSIHSEKDCIMFAIDFLNDPDGIEGKAFIHYASEKMSNKDDLISLKEYI